MLTTVLQILICGDAWNLKLYSPSVENGKTPDQHNFQACQTIKNHPGTLKVSKSPWFHMSICAMIYMEDIFEHLLQTVTW